MTSACAVARRDGFTLIELMVAISLLAIAFLGMGSVVPNLISSASRAEVEFLTLNSVEDRIEMIMMDPRYLKLDSIYTEGSKPIDGLATARRSTDLQRTVTQVGTRTLDFTTVTVTAVSTSPPRTVVRTVVVGAP